MTRPAVQATTCRRLLKPVAVRSASISPAPCCASPGSACRAPLVHADLDDDLPFLTEDFEAILCALAGEHLRNLPVFFRGAFAALKPEGRLVFSVFHPAMVEAGIESNFELSGVEYRLGAQRRTVDDYLNAAAEAGFRRVDSKEFHGDAQLVQEVPWAVKYSGRPLLLVVQAWRES